MFARKPIALTRISSIASVLLSLLFIVPTDSGAARPAVDLRIRNVTVISADLRAPIHHADVLVDKGRIVAVGTHTNRRRARKTLDGTGKFLIPGLIDSHVHLYHATGLKPRFTKDYESLYSAYQDQMPRSYLYYGYTTLVELNSDFETNRRFEASPVHPDLCHCGQGLVLSNDFMATDFEEGEFFEAFPNFLHDRFTTPKLPQGLDPAQHTPAATVARIAKSGGRCVKLYYEEALWWPGPKPDFALPSEAIVKEVVREAHRRGMPVLLHATTPRGHEFAISTGVDVVAHGPWEWPNASMAEAVTEPIGALGDTIATSGIRMQPTIQVLRNERSLFDPAFLDDPALASVLPPGYLTYLRTDAQVQKAQYIKKFEKISAALGVQADPAQIQRIWVKRYEELLGRMERKGTRFLFGTDTAVGGLGWGNPPGLNGYWEMQEWVRAGISLNTLFRAATLENAKTFGLGREVGSVTVGKRANLLLLAKNPLEQVEAYDAIEMVILNGSPIERSQLRAK